MTKQNIREEETDINDLKKYAQSNSCGRLEINLGVLRVMPLNF